MSAIRPPDERVDPPGPRCARARLPRFERSDRSATRARRHRQRRTDVRPASTRRTPPWCSPRPARSHWWRAGSPGAHGPGARGLDRPGGRSLERDVPRLVLRHPALHEHHHGPNPASGCFDVQQRGSEEGTTVVRFESRRPTFLTVARTPGLPAFTYPPAPADSSSSSRRTRAGRPAGSRPTRPRAAWTAHECGTTRRCRRTTAARGRSRRSARRSCPRRRPPCSSTAATTSPSSSIRSPGAPTASTSTASTRRAAPTRPPTCSTRRSASTS